MHKIVMLLLLCGSPWAFGHDNSSPTISLRECMQLLEGQGMRAGRPNPNHRLMVRGQELLKLKAKEPTSVFFVDAREVFKKQSHENLTRLLSRLDIPELRKISPSDARLIDSLVDGFHFLALAEWPMGIDEPIGPSDDFYSRLVGGSKTVSLKYAATPDPGRLTYLRGQTEGDAIRAPEAFVREFGMVLPNFTQPMALIAFFYRWDPAAVEALVKHNRLSLPSDVRSADDLIRYLDPARMEQTFPAHSWEHRLAPLRQRLYQYVLTPEDAETLFRHCLRAYIMYAIEHGQSQIGEFAELLRAPRGPGFMFKEALRVIAWSDGAMVRIPLNLPTYSALKIREATAMDPRRLDRRNPEQE